jgi:transposase-like protein
MLIKTSSSCPSCEHTEVTLSPTKHTFEYGTNIENIVLLTAIVPVYTCDKCNKSWLNECGHVLIEYAIEQHINSLVKI